jgi:hypothetical protein
MNDPSTGVNKLSPEDFNHIFTKYLDNNNQSKAYIYGGENKQRLWYGTVRAASFYKKKSTISPR